MSDVRLHANLPKPVRLNALAYTQGNQIYLGVGAGEASGPRGLAWVAAEAGECEGDGGDDGGRGE